MPGATPWDAGTKALVTQHHTPPHHTTSHCMPLHCTALRRENEQFEQQLMNFLMEQKQTVPEWANVTHELHSSEMQMPYSSGTVPMSSVCPLVALT